MKKPIDIGRQGRDIFFREFLRDMTGPEYKEILCPEGVKSGEIMAYAMSVAHPPTIDMLPQDQRARVTDYLPEHVKSCELCRCCYETLVAVNEALFDDGTAGKKRS